MISSLIMDISGSSGADKEVFDDLKTLESDIRTWILDDDFSHVDYRMGDELFVLSSTPHNTLFIAIYAKLLWPHNDFPLKCSFHTADVEPPAGDPEQWSHQSIKDTREALGEIKKSAIQDFTSPGLPDRIAIPLMYLTDIINNMTPLQREVALLKLSGRRQTDIARILDKNESTVSAHYSKSRGRQFSIIMTYLSDHYGISREGVHGRFRESVERRFKP
ncbi:sigma factor-like helix-turn-helix DNA-binding protein [Salinicoccus carnicancri]|uniref:sigma-70 region 4 domain-containing protein n=1 Tax=Salinicoccus carnicancri TaxID=558170 RepID=UPI000300E6C5|nr:sigma-70 region 4 domain-containing protein [Salinicoccus carnicancri]